MPTFSRAKLEGQALPAPGYYAGLARDITMQYSGPDGTTEIWRVPLFDPDGKLIVIATLRNDEKSEWALINLVCRSGVRMPDGDASIVVRPSDFEGLVLYFNIKHSKARQSDRTFVNVIFQRREWAVDQNPALAAAEALFPSAREPGVYAVESAPARSPMTNVPQTSSSSSDAAGGVVPPRSRIRSCDVRRNGRRCNIPVRTEYPATRTV
jgi:hypothetical protein